MLPAPSNLISDAKQMFLTRKEKVVGGMTTVGLAGLAVVAGNYALPYVLQFLDFAIAAVGKTIVLGGLLVLLVFLAYILLDPRTWSLLWYQQRVFSAKATRLFVKLNHLDIMRIFAEDYLTQMHGDVANKAAEVGGIEGEILTEIQTNQRTIEQKTEEAASIQKRYYDEVHRCWTDDEQGYLFDSLSTDVGLAQDSNAVLAEQLKNAQGWKKSLDDLERAFRFEKRNTLAFVQVLTRQYQLTEKVAHVGQSLQGYLTGANDKKKVFDMAVQYTRQRVAQYAAIANTALKIDPAFVKQADLRTNVYADRMYRTLSSGAAHLLRSAEETSQHIADGKTLDLVINMKRREPVLRGDNPQPPAPPAPPLNPGGQRKYKNLLK